MNSNLEVNRLQREIQLMREHLSTLLSTLTSHVTPLWKIFLKYSNDLLGINKSKALINLFELKTKI